MARRITVTGETRRRIETDARTARKVDQAVVAAILRTRVSAPASLGVGIVDGEAGALPESFADDHIKQSLRRS